MKGGQNKLYLHYVNVAGFCYNKQQTKITG